MGGVIATDPDPGASLSFALLPEADGALFTIDPDGTLRVATGAALDFEAGETRQIVVQIADETSRAITRTLGVTLADVVGETLTGTAGNDTLRGGAGVDRLSGLGGDDVLIGGADADSLDGGPGSDTLVAADDDALIDGGTGIDTARFGAPVTPGLADSELANVEVAEITGTGAGSYDFSGQSESALTILGGGAADTIIGTGNADVVLGGDGADAITGAGGADSLLGGGGDDVLVVTDGDALIDGGAGTDTARFEVVAAVTTNLLDSELVNVEVVQIAVPQNFLTYDFSVQGEALTIIAGGNFDTIIGGSGADRISAGGATDVVFGGAGADSLLGEGGDDTLVADDGDALIDGGAQVDTVRFAASVTTNLLDSELVNVEAVEIIATAAGSYDFSAQSESGLTILGGGAADTIVGTSNADAISGGSGNDAITGGAGADSLSGGDGDDRAMGGAGNDVLNGGGGNDTADYGYTSAGVTVTISGSGSVTVVVAPGDTDTLVSIEGVIGGGGDDRLVGDAVSGGRLRGDLGNDMLVGAPGNDGIVADYGYVASGITVDLTTFTGTVTVVAGAGDTDMLDGINNVAGGQFDDVLIGNVEDKSRSGGGGNDRLRSGSTGASGFDTLNGGSGEDTADYGGIFGTAIAVTLD
ncbi:MAG: hypothetical protein ACK52I_17665, partial [Pseudomonadota bacterium]